MTNKEKKKEEDDSFEKKRKDKKKDEAPWSVVWVKKERIIECGLKNHFHFFNFSYR